MNERKTARMRERIKRAEREQNRFSVPDQIAEALRLSHGIADLKTLLNLCPWLNVKAAVELDVLVERRTSDGQQTFVAGPRLKDEKCDFEKVFNMVGLVEMVSRQR